MGRGKAIAAAARVESKLESREKMLVLAYVGPHWAKRVEFLGTAPGPGGPVGCILSLCWLTLSHMGGPSWAKRSISRHRVVSAYVGPHWAKRVTFLGTAPGPGGHVGCILGLSWLTLSHMGGPSWAKRYISRHRAQSRWACWVHIGLVLGGPSWTKRVAFLGTAPTLAYMGGPL